MGQLIGGDWCIVQLIPTWPCVAVERRRGAGRGRLLLLLLLYLALILLLGTFLQQRGEDGLWGLGHLHIVGRDVTLSANTTKLTS